MDSCLHERPGIIDGHQSFPARVGYRSNSLCAATRILQVHCSCKVGRDTIPVPAGTTIIVRRDTGVARKSGVRSSQHFLLSRTMVARNPLQVAAVLTVAATTANAQFQPTPTPAGGDRVRVYLPSNATSLVASTRFRLPLAATPEQRRVLPVPCALQWRVSRAYATTVAGHHDDYT